MPIVKQQAPKKVDSDERSRPRDFEGLLAGLEDDNPVARRWSARNLAEFPSSSGALVARLKRENDATVREALLTALTYLGDQTAVAGLVECLHSEDAALRNEAIDAMKQLPEAIAPIMGELLNDADPDVRIFAVNILESLRHPEVEVWLDKVIEQDPHINVCATAVDLLGEVGTQVSRPALERLKARFPDEPYILFAADLALKRIDVN
jgi:HEAT repeat protein